MTPATWTSFWTILIAGSIGGFGVLAVVVAIRGLGDIRVMLRGMKSRDSDLDPPSSH